MGQGDALFGANRPRCAKCGRELIPGQFVDESPEGVVHHLLFQCIGVPNDGAEQGSGRTPAKSDGVPEPLKWLGDVAMKFRKDND